jgi:hypothetical protein
MQAHDRDRAAGPRARGCPGSRVRGPASYVLRNTDAVLFGTGLVATRSLAVAAIGVFTFRLAAVIGALANEWAHVIMALGHGAGRNAWNRENLLGHRSLRVHASALVPFSLDRRGDLHVDVRGLTLGVASQVRVVGFWLSAASTAAAALVTARSAFGTAWFPVAASFAAGGLLSVVASFATDVAASSPYRAHPSLMGCGNLTLLGRLLPGESRAVPPRIGAMLRAMLQVTQMRGAQSGGGAVKVGTSDRPRQIIVKCVKAKRSNLAAQLTRLTLKAGRARASGSSVVVQTHVRFATSGPATREESHPFRFVEASQRGDRRVFRPTVLEARPATRPIETAITHNGDLNALSFRGVRIAHPELGYFLERVLDAENRWTGDSPSLAGAFELFLTQGMWLESLRLAYLEVVAPPPPDISVLTAPQGWAAHAAFVREQLREYPVASHEQLSALAEIAERVWIATKPSPRSRLHERAVLAERLATALRSGPLGHLDAALVTAFARAAIDRFLDVDLFRAAREIEAAVEGTFGCVITSTLEPDTVVAFARGQPLSMGVQTKTGTVAIVSERNALRARGEDGASVFDARLDFDLTNAEIARIATGDLLQPQLSLYCVAERRTYELEELEQSGRLVSLRDNPLTPALPIESKSRVRQDLADLPTILRAVRDDYARGAGQLSHNRRSAETLAYALLSHPSPRLLLLGITNDLWLAQQFVENLKLCLPRVRAEAMSSNQFLKESAANLVDPGTVVLAVSQSGQDFPTMAALYQLRHRFGEAGHGRLFVLTGEADTLMGQAVGQSFAKRALWLGRILTNCGGYRPSEAATASVNATHAALCELLFVTCDTAQEFPHLRHGLALGRADLEALRARRDACIEEHVVRILDRGAKDREASPIARKIARQGQRFGRHVLEGIVAFVLAWLVLEANLAFGLKLKPTGVVGLVQTWVPAAVASMLGRLVTQTDVLYYLFLTPLFVWLLRLVDGRPRLHRHGVRELLIADTAYVRQIVWLLSRKLFSLSYGFASLKAYAADNQDDLVMTHEPLRGTLALFGVPDGRREHLRVHESAAWMTATQFASSRSIGGARAEVITVGHEPASPMGIVHLGLPSAEVSSSHRVLDLLVEGMFDSWERMLAMQSLVSQAAEAVASVYPLVYDISRTKDQVFAPTTASPVSVGFLGRGGMAKEVLRFSRTSLPFEILVRRTRMTATVEAPSPLRQGASAPPESGR